MLTEIDFKKYKMRHIIKVLASLATITVAAQKVGVNTSTPTEILDVSGTLRVRDLPTSGARNAIYTIGENTASSNKDQSFNSTNIVVANQWGVLGKISSDKDLIPNDTTEGFDATNNSTSMFVIKRYSVSEADDNNDKSFDTGMSVANWEGIISGWMLKFDDKSTATTAADFFNPDVKFGYRLKAVSGGNWYIIGNVATVREKAEIDVLFIKKEFVAADTRTQ